MSEINSSQQHNYKIVVEIAGCDTQGFNGWLELSQGPIISGQHLATLGQASISARRLQLPFLRLDNLPYNLWLAIGSANTLNGCYYVPLSKQIQPVAHGIEKPEWDNVLIPIVPLFYVKGGKGTAGAKMPAPGWLYLFVNGYLWRELEFINTLGAMRDVDLAMEANKDHRKATCHIQPHVLVPYKLNGSNTKISFRYSQTQYPWKVLCRLGGISPNDNRFNPTVRKKSRTAKVDPNLQRKFLIPLDLSSYKNGFKTKGNIIAIEACPRIGTPHQPNSDLLKPFRDTKIPAVFIASV